MTKWDHTAFSCRSRNINSEITNRNEYNIKLTLCFFSNDGQLLHIINVIGLDQGTYKCATRNDYGSDEASEYVDVLSK